MKRDFPQLVISDNKGKIYNLANLIATGMKGGYFFRLRVKDLIPLPSGSELFMLPDRKAVGFDPQRRGFVTLDKIPFSRNKRCFAVSAFVSPGFTISYSSAYREIGRPKILPLFSYAAVPSGKIPPGIKELTGNLSPS